MSSIEDLQAKLDGLKEDMQGLRAELRCASPGLPSEEARELTDDERRNIERLANLVLEYSAVKAQIDELQENQQENSAQLGAVASAVVTLSGRYSGASNNGDTAHAVVLESEVVASPVSCGK